MDKQESIETVKRVMELMDCEDLTVWEYDFVDRMAGYDKYTTWEVAKIKEIYKERIG